MTAEGHAHLQGPTTTVVRCLALSRRDGLTLGFTDHDRALSFEGIAFRPESGTALSALAFGTGLAVDNAEATGALSDAVITEADIRAGRWDEARALYAWFLPLLHLDIGSKFVQQIKLVEALVGVGSAKVRAPRMQLSEAEASRVEAILAEALAQRPELD